MEFKSIKACPGYYASKCGQIKGPKKLLKLYKNPKNGYLMFRPGKGKTNYYVHRAVAETWLTTEMQECVNHIDHDKTNNHASNLEWCSYRENLFAFIRKYSRHPHQKLSKEDKRAICELRKQGLSQRAIAKQFNCSQAHIWRILNN